MTCNGYIRAHENYADLPCNRYNIHKTIHTEHVTISFKNMPYAMHIHEQYSSPSHDLYANYEPP
jgi:hypothetical protein